MQVLGQEGAEAAIIAALTKREVEAAGGRVDWRSETIRPGRLLGMKPPGIGPVTVHTLQLHWAHGARHVHPIKQRMEALEGSTVPGMLVFSWASEDLRDCTLLGVLRGPSRL